MLRYLFLSILLLGFSIAFCQQKQKNVVQFSGVVYDADSNSVVPYVNIKVKNSNQNYSANYKGYFSFVCHDGDSLIFSSVGYKKVTIIIPSHLIDHKFTAIIKLKTDNIMLPMVRVFPWASTDEFKKDFLTMKFADDDVEIARKNLSSESLRYLISSLPRDGGENRGLSFNNSHNALINKSGVQVNPLLNPLAWGALINQISEGDKSRKKN
ncbi:MAG: carboxypeptidase-like regulatory domain-containing protein [Sphingobacteriales bacterium]|nr:MAG: carboxypeptidase-like regulatory domain-containing protein [Sphingobacteriales bacterium]TAF80648.1 MAG: carboxypeptidase-like regulatory domain-containing protein [Sphingobacteriales bacterium]